MRELLKKLNYKEQKRIVVLNSEQKFFKTVSKVLKDVITDSEIDQRCPYEFMMIFVKSISDVKHYTPLVLHNLTDDGILWFCYPKKTSRLHTRGLERDKGWDTLNKLDFYVIRTVSVDEDWSAMRFRNKKYIKSISSRYNMKS